MYECISSSSIYGNFARPASSHLTLHGILFTMEGRCGVFKITIWNHIYVHEHDAVRIDVRHIPFQTTTSNNLLIILRGFCCNILIPNIKSIGRKKTHIEILEILFQFQMKYVLGVFNVCGNNAIIIIKKINFYCYYSISSFQAFVEFGFGVILWFLLFLMLMMKMRRMEMKWIHQIIFNKHSLDFPRFPISIQLHPLCLNSIHQVADSNNASYGHTYENLWFSQHSIVISYTDK